MSEESDAEKPNVLLYLENQEYSDDRSMQRRNPIRRQRNVLDDEQTKDAMKLLEKYVRKKYGNGMQPQDTFDLEGQAGSPVGHTQSAMQFTRQLTPSERFSQVINNVQPPWEVETNFVDEIQIKERESWGAWFFRVAQMLYHLLGIRYVILAVAILGYACLGGYIFQNLEYENQLIDLEAERQVKVEESTLLAQNLLNYMKRWNCSHSNEKKCLELITKAFVERSDKVENDIRGEGWRWDFWNSVFFAATIFTTIGYGNLACKTNSGRIVTIIYGLIGIPLMLFVLKIFGEMAIRWAQKVRYCFKRNIRRCLKKCRCFGLKRANTIESVLSTELYCDSDSEEEEERLTTFPVAWALFIVFLFMVICSFIVSFWEKWDFLTAFYFFFVSLSTIGFGDVIPEHPRTACALFILYFVGLALFSMVYAILQERVENQYMWALELIDQEYQENHKLEEEHEKRELEFEKIYKKHSNLSDGLQVRWRAKQSDQSTENMPDRPESERRFSVMNSGAAPVLAAFMNNMSVKKNLLARSESILNKQGSPWPHNAEMNHPQAPTNLTSGLWLPRHDGTSAPNLAGGNRSPSNALSVITEASDEDGKHFKKHRIVKKVEQTHGSAESLDQVMDELQLEGNDQAVTPKPYKEPKGDQRPLLSKNDALEEEDEDESEA